MAIEITKTTDTVNNVHTITGAGYYARIGKNGFGRNVLMDAKFITGTAYVPAVDGEQVIISDVPTLALTGIDPTDSPERELELFIRYLYGPAVIRLDAVSTLFNLQGDLEASGTPATAGENPMGRGAGGKLNINPLAGENHYTAIDPYDFAVLTGAIPDTFPRLEQGGSRPSVDIGDVGDTTTTKNVIRTLGIWGYSVDLFAMFVFSIEDLKEMLAEWKPIQADRMNYVYSYIEPYLRIRRPFRLLSEEELQFMWDENLTSI